MANAGISFTQVLRRGSYKTFRIYELHKHNFCFKCGVEQWTVSVLFHAKYWCSVDP